MKRKVNPEDYGFASVDEEVLRPLDLMRQMEKDNFDMLQNTFSMSQQIYEANLNTFDFFLGFVRYAAGLGAAGIFAAVGIAVFTPGALVLVVVSIVVFIGSVIAIVPLIVKRNKVIKARVNDYKKLNEVATQLADMSKTRINALKLITEDDSTKLAEMFDTLGYNFSVKSNQEKSK